MQTMLKTAPRIAIPFGVREALIWLAVAVVALGALAAIWAVARTSFVDAEENEDE